MKQFFFAAALACVALSVLAQNRDLSRTQQQIDNDMQQLLSEALKKGEDKSETYSVYTINNHKGKSVNASDAKRYLSKNGYIPISASEKSVLRFGANRTLLDKVRFIAKSDFPAYALASAPYDFRKATGNAKMFIPKMRDSWYWGHEICDKIISYDNVLWTGDLLDGFIHGEGCGFMPFDGGYACFKGRFVAGFPKNDITNFMIRYADLSSNYKTINKIGYWDLVRAKETASGDLLAAMKHFARFSYVENAGNVVDEYQRTFDINKGYEQFKPNKDVIQEFRTLYGDWPELDSQGILDLTDELVAVYAVWDALHFKFHPHYISGFVFINWNAGAVDGDYATINNGLRIAEEKGKDSQFAFRPFCNEALPILKTRKKDLEKHLEEERQYYEARVSRMEDMQEASKAYNAKMCEKCMVDAQKSTVPTGYVDGWSFLFIFGAPAQSKEDGVIVMQNGDRITWKYVWGEDFEGIVASGAFMNETHFESEDEMIKSIIEQCQKRYCR